MSRQFAVIPERATFDRAVTPAMYRMLGALGTYATRDGWCWPELSTLADRLEQTESAVQKMIRKLIEAGYVEMHYETRKGRRCCVYRILYDRPASTLQAITDEELEAGDEGAPDASSHPPLSPTESLDENELPGRLDVKESQPGERVEATSTRRPGRQVPTFPQRESVFLEEGAVERVTASPPPAARPRWQGMLDRAAALSSPHARALADAIAKLVAESDYRANAFVAELEAIEQGMHGPAATLEQIAAALHEMAVAGAELKAGLIRGYVRGVRQGEAAPRRGRASGLEASPAVSVGGQQLEAGEFWRLCTDSGLTAPMQSPETIRETAERLHARGLVQDPAAFARLVLHVNPSQLAEIKFGLERETQLRARLAGWTGGRAA